MSGITICSLQGKEVNCSEIFTPVVSDSGVCCAFNLHMDLKESKYSKLVEEMQVEKLPRWKIFKRIMLRLFESFISTQHPSLNKQHFHTTSISKQTTDSNYPYFHMYSKRSLTQGKAGASAYVARRVSPGLDRGLEVTIDRNFNRYLNDKSPSFAHWKRL